MRPLPFFYTECLPPTTLKRMPEALKITGENDPELLLILRLLSGSVKLKHVSTSHEVCQKDNYFLSNFCSYNQYWDKNFPKLIGEDYTSEQLALFIEGTKQNNKKFYRNILGEISYFLYYQAKNIHSSAFVFLYRALEHVSYAFPLIYASKTEDFSKTYNFLKDLMSGDKAAGELGFFKSFINTVYDGDEIKDSYIEFEILIEDEKEQKKTFQMLKQICKGNIINTENTIENRVLAIKYCEAGSFLITIRNRFFHFMNGGAKNLESVEIVDIDIFFSLVNKKLLYWLTTVFLAIISENATNFEKIKNP